MTQAEEHEALVAACAAALYGENWNGPENRRPGEKMKEVWRNQVRHILAVIAEKATGDWPTEGMLYAPGIPVAHVRAIWREMFAASPMGTRSQMTLPPK